jgi:trans-2-enoyl-CoA reductase
MDCKLEISDKKGRTLIKMKCDRVLVARYPEMSEEIKKIIVDFYTEFTGENSQRVIDFLNYNNEELEFCS